MLDHDARVEYVVAKVADEDVLDFGTHLDQDRLQQVMGQGTRHWNTLQFHADRLGFRSADPDWQIAIRLLVFQNYDAILRHQAHADAINFDPDHVHPAAFGEMSCVMV